MHGEVIAFLLLLAIGCAAFLYGVVWLVARCVGVVGGAFLSVLGLGPRHRTSASAREVRVCTNYRCRRIETRTGRYCASCGAPLSVEVMDWKG